MPLPYKGMAAILFNGADPFEKFSMPFRQKTPCGKKCSNSFKEDICKLHNFIHVYIAQEQGQIIPRGKTINCNVKVLLLS